jgi:hypothetical protein
MKFFLLRPINMSTIFYLIIIPTFFCFQIFVSFPEQFKIACRSFWFCRWQGLYDVMKSEKGIRNRSLGDLYGKFLVIKKILHADF